MFIVIVWFMLYQLCEVYIGILHRSLHINHNYTSINMVIKVHGYDVNYIIPILRYLFPMKIRNNVYLIK